MIAFFSLGRAMLLLAAIAALASPAGCAHSPAPSGPTQAWSSSAQMIVVTTPDWNASNGWLRTFERTPAGWQQVGKKRAVTLGRSGSAWGLGLHPTQSNGPLKREGDGRSPAGIFKVGPAFGYSPTATTGLDYQAMLRSHYCIDVSESPRYNRIVDASVVGDAAVAGSTEPMRLDLHASGDQRYRLGFVIDHNPQGTPMGGSCIFAHLWKSPTDATSGCTAMDPDSMAALLSWLHRDRRPVFLLLPDDQYARLQTGWQLPSLENDR